MRISHEYVPWTNWNKNYIDYKSVIDMEFVTWLSVCRSKQKESENDFYFQWKAPQNRLN